MSDSSDEESGIAGIETFYTFYCSIEDITGKPSTQLKAPALILNPNGVIVRKLFDNTRRGLTEIAS